MPTRIKHYPAVPGTAWGNITGKDIPEHWSVEQFAPHLGWFSVSDHVTKAIAKDAEASLYLPASPATVPAPSTRRT